MALVLGAGLNQFTMVFREAFGELAEVLQVDLETQTTNPRINHFISADNTTVVDAVLLKLRTQNFHAPRRLYLDDNPLTCPGGDALAADGRLDPHSLMRQLNGILPANKFVASDGGHFIGGANTYFDLESRDSIVLLGTAFQSIGLGFPTAVGVATAAGQRAPHRACHRQRRRHDGAYRRRHLPSHRVRPSLLTDASSVLFVLPRLSTE